MNYIYDIIANIITVMDGNQNYFVGLCELDTADGPYNKTGYQLERREDGFAITVGLMEYISGWSALEILYWLHEKQAIPRRYDNARRQ